MTEPHPNNEVLMKLDLCDLDASAGLFSDSCVRHFFIPKLPDVQGDYDRVAGLETLSNDPGRRGARD